MNYVMHKQMHIYIYIFIHTYMDQFTRIGLDYLDHI